MTPSSELESSSILRLAPKEFVVSSISESELELASEPVSESKFSATREIIEVGATAAGFLQRSRASWGIGRDFSLLSFVLLKCLEWVSM